MQLLIKECFCCCVGYWKIVGMATLIFTQLFRLLFGQGSVSQINNKLTVFCPSPKLLLSTQHCLPTCLYCRPQCTEIQNSPRNIILGTLSFVVRTLLSGMLERTLYSLISYQPRKIVLYHGHFHHLNHTLKAEWFIFRCTVYLCCHTFLSFYQLLKLVSVHERRKARGMRRVTDLCLLDLQNAMNIDIEYLQSFF